MDLENHFVGCFLGLAIGDALGFPVEFMNRLEIQRVYGTQGVTDFVPTQYDNCIGIYSDDTQMSIAVGQALLDADISDLDDIMKHIKYYFCQWADSSDNNRAPGSTCMNGIRNMQQGMHWFSSGDPYSKGCGAAMRVAPIGLLFYNNPNKLIEVTRAVSCCTHLHPTGIASAIVAASAVAYVVNKRPLEKMLQHLRQTLIYYRSCNDREKVSYDPLEEQVHLLDKLPQIMDINPEFAFDEIGGGWVGEEAVAGALYSFLRSPDEFRTTVLTAANACLSDVDKRGYGRCDSDSIACIAGSISGAHLGKEKIPQKWQKEIENRELLIELGAKIAEKASCRANATKII